MKRSESAVILTLGLFALASSSFAQVLSGSGGAVLGGSARPRPLPMEQAFPYFVSLIDDATLAVTWQIAPDHYLYRHQFDFSLQYATGESSRPVGFKLPDGMAKTDQFFGDIEAYYDTVTATLSTSGASLPEGTSLVIQFQGCADWGFCYPPQTSVYPFNP